MHEVHIFSSSKIFYIYILVIASAVFYLPESMNVIHNILNCLTYVTANYSSWTCIFIPSASQVKPSLPDKAVVMPLSYIDN